MSVAAPRTAIQSSELSRNSSAVFAAAERAPVAITRRDGEDFVLARASVVDDERRAIQIAADLVRALLATTDASLGERMREQFAWVEFLCPADRETCAMELLDVARACASLGAFGPLLVTFDEWRSTASAVAAGYTSDAQLDWLQESVPVPDPRA